MTSWLTELSPGTPFESVLAHRPELLEGYRAFYGALWEEGLVPHRILEICRLRIAAIHDCEAEWVIRDATVALNDGEIEAIRKGATDSFNDGEQAALAVAERIPYQHHELSDDEVRAVRQTLGDAGCVSLLNALALFDANCRLKLVFGIGGEAMRLQRPPGPDSCLP